MPRANRLHGAMLGLVIPVREYHARMQKGHGMPFRSPAAWVDPEHGRQLGTVAEVRRRSRVPRSCQLQVPTAASNSRELVFCRSHASKVLRILCTMRVTLARAPALSGPVQNGHVCTG